MNVNLPLKGFSDVTNAAQAAAVPPAPARPSGSGTARPALMVTESPSGAAGVEEIPDSALRRDDDLGKLFSAAFTLPPPPMPAFGDA